ncbi:MAG TPA: sulfotransferase [Fimbriimonadaceae bacterium]|nr:sulfotransferase [Fimbriimonadaceae bacterium]
MHSPQPDPGSVPLAAAQRAERDGRIQEAEAQVRTALASNPASVPAGLLLARIASRTGRAELARLTYQGILNREPGCVEAWVGLARFFRSALRHDEAVHAARQALGFDPNHADAHFVLGICLLDQWLNEEAVGELRRSVSLDPQNPMAFDRLGFALQRVGRTEEALGAYRQAIALAPTLPNTYVNLGQSLVAGGNEEEAHEAFSQAVACAGNAPAALVRVARAFIAIGATEQAESVLRRAVEVDPAQPELWRQFASVLTDEGQFGEAADAYRTAIGLDPHQIRLYYDLFYCSKVRDQDRPLVDALERLGRQPSIPPEERSQLHYALGKAHDDFGEFEDAMRHFHEANRASRVTRPAAEFNRKALSDLIDRMIAVFTPQALNQAVRYGSNSPRPTFILGMIRSGTTLLEQVISSHPQVSAAGELTYLSVHGIPIAVAGKLDGETVGALAAGYLDRLKAAAPTGERVTDKMPDNYLVAGLIHVAFPEARIIHCARGALDNCLSIYTTPIAADYANSFDNIAFYYRECHRLMAHWRAVLPSDRFLEIQYEEFVTDREPHLRRVLEFLDLPWDDAVLEHRENKRVINTPSRWQAKQPIYRSSVARWRNFEPWIGELLEAFPELK